MRRERLQMDCSEYRSSHERYTDFPVPRSVWDTPHHDAWRQHGLQCRECTDWALAKSVVKRGFDPADWPCVHMAEWATFTCEQHPILRNCSNAVIGYDNRFDEYSILPRGGDGDAIVIRHCPVCGVQLPESQRDAYFDALETLGVEIENAPPEFDDDTWRKLEP